MDNDDVNKEMDALAEKYDLDGVVLIIAGEEEFEAGILCKSDRFHKALPGVILALLKEADRVRPFPKKSDKE